MNKNNTQSTLKLFLLIITALSSGCGQSTIADSPTTTHENITITPTPISCDSFPKISITDDEKIAEEWFKISKPDIPNRNLYSTVNDWKTFCQLYQNAASNGEEWIKSHVDTAVLTMGISNQDEFFPDKVVVIVNPDNHSIATVVVTKLNMIVKVAEGRVDLVREDGIWQIMWLGTRVKCNSAPDNWSITGC